jgi:phospholipase C
MKPAMLPLAIAIAALCSTPVFAAEPVTATPIKHVIVVVGENASFDTVFGVYQPLRGQSIFNLWSQGIVKADGTPGPNYARAVQKIGRNQTSTYTVQPERVAPYASLPQPLLTGALKPDFTFSGPDPDPRFEKLTLNGPFQITKFVPYGSATTGDPVHRFFQMWQQTGGTNQKLDMWTWVATTAGQGGDTAGVTVANPGQGGELMGFYNMAKGDAPFFKSLADNYAISDNFHQAVMGGTGANFFALATGGDLPRYQLADGTSIPPANQIEDPNPAARTTNFYQQDGYSGGSYVNCADPAAPGVAAIAEVLAKKRRASRCEPGAYYLVNNYTPPFKIDGDPNELGADKFVYPPQSAPTIGEALSAKGVSWKWYTGGRDLADLTTDPLYPLVFTPTRAKVKAALPPGTPDAVIDSVTNSQLVPLIYNNIGDPLNASKNVVNNPALKANLKGLATLYADLQNGSLPAVSFVVPKNLDSGHPGYSVPGKYELFLADLIAKVKGSKAWNDTAVIVTTDEGGGSFDSGYIQPLDFFGDGPRIPLLVISPYAKKGHVDHVYHDHASILKFIQHNWSVAPLSSRSRDQLPNPRHDEDNPYQPANEPAIGDLTTLFTFSLRDEGQGDGPGRDDDERGRGPREN